MSEAIVTDMESQFRASPIQPIKCTVVFVLCIRVYLVIKDLYQAIQYWNLILLGVGGGQIPMGGSDDSVYKHSLVVRIELVNVGPE
jgi:hypothetical protein